MGFSFSLIKPKTIKVIFAVSLLLAVPFKSTWEEGMPFFFIFLLVVGVKHIVFMFGGFFFFLLVGGSEISGVPPSQVYLNGTALSKLY